MIKYHLLGLLVQTKERECESLIVYFEDYVTFSFVGNKSSISGLNPKTAWEQFCFIFRMQAVLRLSTNVHNFSLRTYICSIYITR